MQNLTTYIKNNFPHYTKKKTIFLVKNVPTPSHVWGYSFFTLIFLNRQFHTHETAAVDCRCFCISHVCTNTKTKVRYIFGFIHQENLMSLQPDTGTFLLMHEHPYKVPFAAEKLKLINCNCQGTRSL